MAKDWEDKGYFGKMKSARKMSEHLGVDYKDYGSSRPGHYTTKKGDYQDFQEDVAKAASNNYDYRRSLEAAKAAGVNLAGQDRKRRGEATAAGVNFGRPVNQGNAKRKKTQKKERNSQSRENNRKQKLPV